MSETSPKRPRSNSTKGEELFLVHLKRTTAPDPHPEDAEDDHDYEHPRHPQKTVGEELFEVHLKRSQGFEPDYDIDPDEAKPAASNGGGNAEEEEKPHYNLRNRKTSSAVHHH